MPISFLAHCPLTQYKEENSCITRQLKLFSRQKKNVSHDLQV